MGYGSGTTAGTLHVAWMSSTATARTCSRPQFDSVGIGVFCAPDGSMWATTSFGRTTGRGRGPAAGRRCPPLNRSCGAIRARLLSRRPRLTGPSFSRR